MNDETLNVLSVCYLAEHLVLSKTSTETFDKILDDLVLSKSPCLTYITGFTKPEMFIYTYGLRGLIHKKILPCFIGPIIVDRNKHEGPFGVDQRSS